MRQSYALVLAVFLTAFILALALGFARLSSEERRTVSQPGTLAQSGKAPQVHKSADVPARNLAHMPACGLSFVC
jgi:hypothetical protein